LYNAKLDVFQPMLIDEIRRCNDTRLCWLALNALTQYEPEQFSDELVSILRSIYHEQIGRTATNLEIRLICGQLLLRTDISVGDLANLIVRLSVVVVVNDELYIIVMVSIQLSIEATINLARSCGD
jgi:hypothetical protein